MLRPACHNGCVARRVKNPAVLAANVTQNVISVFHAGKEFHLRRPLDLETWRRKDLYFVSLPELGITEYGDTETEALEAFAEHFSSAWHWIAEERDSALDAEARELKRKLLDLVADIQEA